MKKTLLILTIIVGTIILIYSTSLILDYMVTAKYHIQNGVEENIVYTVRERAKEIAFLNRYFYCSIGFSLLTIGTSLVALFSKA